MTTIDEVLGASPLDDNTIRYSIPSTFHGAFGGVFGGLLASACIQAARRVAPERVPNALDCRFVRGLREPAATATATVLHAGRSLTNVSVDLIDGNGKLCTRATVSFVDLAALQPITLGTRRRGDWKEHGDATPWPPVAPIVPATDSRFIGEDDDGHAIALVVPWDELDWAAESACMAADLAVGPPAAKAGAGQRVSTPNPDLSLRFAGEVTSTIVVGYGRLDGVAGGVAPISLEAWSGDALIANGISSALLLPSA